MSTLHLPPAYLASSKGKVTLSLTCNVFLRSFIGAVIFVCLLLVGFSCSSSDSENEDQAIAETGTTVTKQNGSRIYSEPELEPSTEETSEPVETNRKQRGV